MLKDRWGRQITYLRISVTDRCNMRCVYCMPPEGVVWQSHDTIMTYEEIAAVVRVAAENGVNEVRLTGGEPLVRKGITELVREIAAIPGIEDISLTTNALLLERLAQPLAEAGLKRVNISLDTLQPEKFARITRGGNFDQVWRGILAAEQAGLAPIKLNVVAVRGLNDDELADMARLSLFHSWNIRFIELMPVKNQAPWGPGFPDPNQAYFSVQEIMQQLAPMHPQPVDHKVGNGPAKEYRLAGGLGKVSFITPIGEQFCGQCNRLRLTADGFLKPCLLTDQEVAVLPALRAGQPILPLLQQVVDIKPQGHELSQNHLPAGRCMQQVGG